MFNISPRQLYDFAIGKYNPPPSTGAYRDTYIKIHNDSTKSAYA